MIPRMTIFGHLRKLFRKRSILLFVILVLIVPLPLLINYCTIIPTGGWCQSSQTAPLSPASSLSFKAFPRGHDRKTLDARLQSWRNFSSYDIGDRRVHVANCPALLSGDAKEQRRALEIVKHYKRSETPPGWYFHMTENCTNFLLTRKYILDSITDEENEFPIAYSILIFKDIDQVERLLRAIYRPQNYYCIHVDSKSNSMFKTAISLIAGCFSNVFIAPQHVNVRWGYFSVLEADLVCMEALWSAGKWNYFINLTGQEFPLKTNWDIVKILAAYNGSNNIEGTIKRMTPKRYTTVEPVPYNMTLTKGSVHIVVSRAFVDYVLHAEPAQALLRWSRNIAIPDEVFFSILNHNPQMDIPGTYKAMPLPSLAKLHPHIAHVGIDQSLNSPDYQFPESYIGIPETDAIKYPFLTRLKNWGDWTCGGQTVRQICVFGVKDLPLLVSRHELFANKFYYDFQPQTLDCLEEWHYNQTRDEYGGVLTFNASYYASLNFVKNRVY